MRKSVAAAGSAAAAHQSFLVGVAAVALAVLCLVAVLNAAAARDAREAFTAVGAPPPPRTVNYATIVGPKTAAYAQAGLRLFYSDGGALRASTPPPLAMLPTAQDAQCGLDPSRCAPQYSRLPYLAAPERRFPPSLNALNNCDELLRAEPEASGRESHGAGSGVRVLNGTYTLTSACVKLHVPAQMAPTVLTLPSCNSSVARWLMLTRPLFLVGSSPRTAPYLVTAAGSTNYDSRARGPLRVPLRRVDLASGPAAAVWDPAAPQLSPGGRRATDAVPLAVTLYYLSYLKPASDQPVDSTVRAITAYIHAGAALTARRDWPIPGTGFRITLYPSTTTRGPRRLTVTTGRANYVLNVPDVPAQARVVVTYATNLLIVAILHRDRVVLRVDGGHPELAAGPAAVRDIIKTASIRELGLPAGARVPYDNLCIPNLAHLAQLLGVLDHQ